MPVGLGMGLRQRGPGMGLRRVSGGITYLLRDIFTTDRAAGAIHNTQAEPGGTGTAAQKTRTVVDTESKLTISGGRLVIAGGKAAPAYGDPGLWYGSIARAAGLCFYARVKLDANNTGLAVGFDSNQSGALSTQMQFSTAGALAILEIGTTIPAITAYAAGEFDVLFILRATGVFVLWKASSSSQWLLEWVGVIDNTANPYPGITNNNTSGYVSEAAVKAVTDDWSTQWGKAALMVAAPASGYTGTGAADAITEFTWTPAAGEVLDLDVRRTDADNRWICRCDQANGWIRIYQRQTGGETQRATAAATWTVGTSYRVVVRHFGNSIQVFQNATYKAQYTSASWNNTATGIGVSGFATGSNLVAWSRSVTAPVPFNLPSTTMRFLAFGDSKTVSDGYQPSLLSSLQTADPTHAWAYTTVARAGYTAALWQAQIDADLGAVTATPDYILVNLGANDVQPLADPLNAATWQTNFAYILDAFHAKWPRAKVYVMRIWRRYNNGDLTNLDDTWIAAVLATRAAWAAVGPDERVFLENGDDGATYTVDGIHPNAAGYTLTASQWKTAMGY